MPVPWGWGVGRLLRFAVMMQQMPQSLTLWISAVHTLTASLPCTCQSVGPALVRPSDYPVTRSHTHASHPRVYPVGFRLPCLLWNLESSTRCAQLTHGQ